MVREVMTRDYLGVNEGDSLLEVARLLRDQQASSALVERGEEPVGIVTEWDVLAAVADRRDPEETTVGTVMSSPLVSVAPEMRLSEAASTMASERIRNLVVRETGEPEGVLTQRDVLAAVGSIPVAANGSGGRGPGEGAAEASADATAERSIDDRSGFSRQGICETCGRLAQQLREQNGQLVCTDCRSV